MEISIIIPVYNAEKYLVRCLDPVLSSLKNAEGELILIDNNSTDGSLKILEEYKEKNKNVRILECKTPGASAVRNFGVKEARGKYLWFVDADDCIDKMAVEKLLAIAKKNNSDITMMGAKRLYRDGSSSYLSAVDEKMKNYKSRFIRYGMGPWQIIIKREWWNENGFKFKEGIIHEDMEMMSSLILHTDNYASIDEPLYFYYENPESVLHKTKWDKHYLDIFDALEGLFNRFKDVGAEKKYHDELEWFFIWNLLIDSAKDFSKFPEGKIGFKRTRKMLKEYFPGWRKNRFLKEKSLKLRLLVRLNYYK